MPISKITVPVHLRLLWSLRLKAPGLVVTHYKGRHSPITVRVEFDGICSHTFDRVVTLSRLSPLRCGGSQIAQEAQKAAIRALKGPFRKELPLRMRLKTVLGVALGTALAILVAPISRADIMTDTSLSAPGLYFGTGNAGLNRNFTVATNGTTELGLSVIQRYVGPIDPGVNSNTYRVTPGVSAAAPSGGSTWGVDFSVNTRYNGGGAVLGNFTYTITIQDLTQLGISGPFITPFDPVRGIPDNTGYGSSGPTAGVDVTTQWGAQNSEAPSFGFFLPGFDINAPDLYEITLSEYNSDSRVVDQVTVFANAAPVPEPTSVLLLGTLAFGAFVAGRRRLAATKPTL